MSKKCTPLWREDARSTFPSQNVQNTRGADHFWQLRCRKSARRCGAKHISKWKCTKHHMFAPLLEVPMWKKCTPLWREAHFEVKMNMYKTPHVRATIGSSDVEKVHAAQSTCRSENVQNTRGSDHFWRFRCRSRGRHKGLCTLSKVRKTCGFCSIFNYNHHYTTLHSNTLHYTTTTTTTTPSLHSTTLRSTTLHCIQLHSITLHYTTLLHYTPLHYTSLHYTTLHFTTLHYTTQPSTTLHYTTLHYTSLHYTTLHSTTLQLHYTTFHYAPLHYTQLHYTTLHYIPLPSTTQHYTALHYTTFHYTTLASTTFRYLPLHSTPLHYTTLHYTTLHWMTLRHR